MPTPIYSYINSSLTPEGTLPNGFHLNPEGADDPKKIKFADGAIDGIQIYHAGFPVIKDAERGQILEILQLANEANTEKATKLLTSLTSKHRAIELIDDIQDVIRSNSDQLDPNEIANYAINLATASDNTELVKTGLIILELIDSSTNEELKTIIKTLGTSDEFTLFSVFIMRHWPNGQMEILDLAKKVRSWGRIHCVNYIEPENDEIREWLLYNGIDNDVLPGYSALEVFRKANVEEIIDGHLSHPENDPDLDEAKAILDIIDVMLEEDPSEGIAEVDDPPGLLAKVLKFTEGRNLDRRMREIVGRVSDLKNRFDGIS